MNSHWLRWQRFGWSHDLRTIVLAEGREESIMARVLGRTQRRRKRKNFSEVRGKKEEHDVTESGVRE